MGLKYCCSWINDNRAELDRDVKESCKKHLRKLEIFTLQRPSHCVSYAEVVRTKTLAEGGISAAYLPDQALRTVGILVSTQMCRRGWDIVLGLGVLGHEL